MQGRDWGLLLLALAGVVVALWAGTNSAVAEPAAAGALLVAALWIYLAIRPRLRRSGPSVDPGRFDRAELLRADIEEGAMGRQTILATISGLESEVFGARRRALTLDEEMRLSRAPAREFRQWVDAHLTELERAT